MTKKSQQLRNNCLSYIKQAFPKEGLSVFKTEDGKDSKYLELKCLSEKSGETTVLVSVTKQGEDFVFKCFKRGDPNPLWLKSKNILADDMIDVALAVQRLNKDVK